MDDKAARHRPGLTRSNVVAAALDLVQEAGLDALSMRPLADRLKIKPASLYWHVRDRDELMELLADAILARVPTVRARGTWRESVMAMCGALASTIAAQRDAARTILEVPATLERSSAFTRLVEILSRRGLDGQTARDVATMLMTYVIVRPQVREDANEGAVVAHRGDLQRIAIDSGSRGVMLRPGSNMESLVRVAREPNGPSPGVVHGDTIVVRRLRGGKQGELEFNPSYPWTFRVQGGTVNTTLDLRGVDVRGIHIDSGAARVDFTLPAPQGVVPIHVSSGVLKCAFHRPASAALVADIDSGSVKVALDGTWIGVVAGDMHWETPRGSSAPDRYELSISSGSVNVTMDACAPETAAREHVPVTSGVSSSALTLVLDGIEKRYHS